MSLLVGTPPALSWLHGSCVIALAILGDSHFFEYLVRAWYFKYIPSVLAAKEILVSLSHRRGNKLKRSGHLPRNIETPREEALVEL